MPILIPMGNGELTPDKPHKSCLRWSKTFGRMSDEGTVDEAGTSDPSGKREFQWQLGNGRISILNSGGI